MITKVLGGSLATAYVLHAVLSMYIVFKVNDTVKITYRKRNIRTHFYSALIKEGKCYGAVFYNEDKGTPEIITGGALVMATGGMNSLFGKTTGSRLNDGYAARQPHAP